MNAVKKFLDAVKRTRLYRWMDKNELLLVYLCAAAILVSSSADGWSKFYILMALLFAAIQEITRRQEKERLFQTIDGLLLQDRDPRVTETTMATSIDVNGTTIKREK